MTFTWGITAPLASFTVPVIWPVAVCAFDVPAMPSRKTSTAPGNATRLLGLMSSSPSQGMPIQTGPPDYASLADPLCNPTPDGKTSETPHFVFAALPSSGAAILVWGIPSVKRCSAVSAVLLLKTCRFDVSLSSDNGVKLHRPEETRRKQRRVRLVRLDVRRRIFRRQASLLIADQPVHPRIGHLDAHVVRAGLQRARRVYPERRMPDDA